MPIPYNLYYSIEIFTVYYMCGVSSHGACGEGFVKAGSSQKGVHSLSMCGLIMTRAVVMSEGVCLETMSQVFITYVFYRDIFNVSWAPIHHQETS